MKKRNYLFWFWDNTMIKNVLKKTISVCMLAAIILSASHQTFAQYGTDSWRTTLQVTGKLWVLEVKTFGIDFGESTTPTSNIELSGTIIGNGGYISVFDTIASSNRYVIVDATNMTMSWNSWTIIQDGLLRMTSVWWAGAVTTLNGWSTSEIVWVTNSNVNFTGSNGFTVIQRTSFASWRVGKYWIQPTFKLDLPAYTPVGNYIGDFVATIYAP